MSRGVDVSFGYDYLWANDSHDPLTLQNYDSRFHTLNVGANFFSPSQAGPRPFFGANAGYQLSRGDLGTLRVFDHHWLWNVAGGGEIPMGMFALTPHVSFTDSMHRATIGSWHCGNGANHWFSEKLGGYIAATFHVPKTGAGSQS